MEHMKLNLVPSDLTKPVCHASQYDDGREIMLELYDGQDPYILSDEAIELDVKKLDGNVVTTELDVVEGNRHVIMETTEQMCAIAGRNICTLKVQKDGATIYTKNFYLAVQENATEGGIESDSNLHDLETQISGLVQDAVENQYDSENVIFDSEPTEGHGTGYTVTSEGIKQAIDAAGGGGASIDDTTTASNKTWSSNKINTELGKKPEIDDASTASNKTWSGEKTASELNGKADIILAERSGNPINMSDSIPEELVKALMVNLPVVQLGTGAPSPTNPRQFVPWTALNIYHGEDKTTYDTYPFALPVGSSVYSGKLNPLTGEFTVEWVAETANNNNWSISSGGNAAQFGHSACKWGTVGSEVYQRCTHWNNTIYSNDDSVILNQNGALLVGKMFWDAVGITPTDQNVKDYFAAQALAGTPLYVCAELKTPYTIQLSPIEIETIEGSEIIWSELNATLDIKYLADTKKYIDRESTEQVKILVFADSLWGEDRTNGVADFLKEYSGAEIYNCAVNGTMICNDSVPASAAFSGISLVHAKVTNTWTDQDTYASQVAPYVATEMLPMLKALDLASVDIVILAYGTNDFSYNRTIAQITASYETAVSELLAAYPTLRIIEIAPPWKTFNNGADDADTYVNTNGETMRELADGIVESAHEHHITTIDMLSELPWRAETAWYYMELDKIHPNINGNKIYAHIVNGKLRSMY